MHPGIIRGGAKQLISWMITVPTQYKVSLIEKIWQANYGVFRVDKMDVRRMLEWWLKFELNVPQECTLNKSTGFHVHVGFYTMSLTVLAYSNIHGTFTCAATFCCGFMLQPHIFILCSCARKGMFFWLGGILSDSCHLYMMGCAWISTPCSDTFQSCPHITVSSVDVIERATLSDSVHFRFPGAPVSSYIHYKLPNIAYGASNVLALSLNSIFFWPCK
jgi:hypothetical protein